MSESNRRGDVERSMVELRDGDEMWSKVPAATVAFWVTKGLTTGMGESASDYFVHRFPPVAAVSVAAIAFAGALGLQFIARRYVPWVYWLAVAMVGVFGTMAADVLHVQFGVPYVASATLFAFVLVVILTVWHRVEGTLSIHSINTFRREVFYWLTIVTTFALGTAVGDLTAVTLHLGYLSSGLMFIGVIAVPAIAYWRFHLNAIVAFWAAYIVTRPLGASFADWMGVSKDRGGLDLGSGWVSLALAILIAALVGWMSADRRAMTTPSPPRRRRGN
ncbi:MAG: hypothetical protein ABIR68_09490 [Ilumatobacteraceae bacterium]